MSTKGDIIIGAQQEIIKFIDRYYKLQRTFQQFC